MSLACPVCVGPISGIRPVIDPRNGGLLVYTKPCEHVMPDDFAAMAAGYLGIRLPKVDGAALIAAERRRQPEEEGYQPKDDAERRDLAWMAWAILDRAMNNALDDPEPPLMWPPDRPWSPGKTPIRALTIVGALAAAEIDRRLLEGEKP